MRPSCNEGKFHSRPGWRCFPEALFPCSSRDTCFNKSFRQIHIQVKSKVLPVWRGSGNICGFDLRAATEGSLPLPCVVSWHVLWHHGHGREYEHLRVFGRQTLHQLRTFQFCPASILLVMWTDLSLAAARYEVSPKSGGISKGQKRTTLFRSLPFILRRHRLYISAVCPPTSFDLLPAVTFRWSSSQS